MAVLKTITGKYWQKASGYVSENWPQICAEHEEEFPTIHDCYPGTFNLSLEEEYLPPNEDFLRRKAIERGRPVGIYVDGNHVSPYARIIQINGKPLEAWIYRGGHGKNPVVELLSRQRLAEYLDLVDGDRVILTIEEIPLGEKGMPTLPPDTPGGLS